MRTVTGLCGLILCLAGCVGGPELEAPLEAAPAAQAFQVLGVINVDTLAVDLDGNGSWSGGNEETVRLLGIRGPNYEALPDQTIKICEYPAKEAVAWLNQFVGQWVTFGDDRIEEGIYRQDPPPEFDVLGDYHEISPGGPWLAYAYVGNIMVNRELLELGYAWVRDDVPCNRAGELRDAEMRARRKGIGVWQFRKQTP